jgi:hypothetical protein
MARCQTVCEVLLGISVIAVELVAALHGVGGLLGVAASLLLHGALLYAVLTIHLPVPVSWMIVMAHALTLVHLTFELGAN